uniref:Uncharacterized protein n=1 Tax=viral metagenome TaxID=1070528 RepID=A0A6M3IN68_9ZZZZ
MTVKGKIVSITFTGRFKVVLDGVEKTFESHDGMLDWFQFVLNNARDRAKRALLLYDLRTIFSVK